MSKPIVMSEKEWTKVFEQIKQRERPSTYLSRTKMRETLGFTVRHHRNYSEQTGYITDVRLDFYNEPKRTMFLLKYGNGEE